MIDNWIDIIIVIYLIIHFFDGTRRGFYSVLVNMTSFLFSLFIALFTYSQMTFIFLKYLSIELVYANIFSFFLIMFLMKFAFLLFSRRILPECLFVINKSIKRRISSGIISSVYSIIVVFLLMSIAFAFSLPHFFKTEFTSSKFGNFIVTDPIKINTNLYHIFGGVVITTINKFDFLTLETEDVDRVELNFKVLNPSINEKLEKEMLELINKERSLRNIEPLVIDEKARDVARKYGIEMFQNGYFSHIDLQGKGPAFRMKKGGVKFMFSGENLALSKDLFSAHDGLMNSLGHKKNILHPFFSRVGIGVIDGGKQYGIIFVQNFAD